MTLIPQISSPKFRAASTSRCGFSKPTCSHLIILRREDLGIERTSHGVSVVRLCTQSEFWEESSPRSTVYLSGLCVEMTVRPRESTDTQRAAENHQIFDFCAKLRGPSRTVSTEREQLSSPTK